MYTPKKKVHFTSSDEGLEAERLLQLMVADKTFNTRASYSTNSVLYPDHLRPFINKHMDYLSSRPNLDPQSYIANLRLMTRIK